MSLKLILQSQNNLFTLKERIASLLLEKDAYTPYSLLRIRMYGAFDPALFAGVYRVKLLSDEEVLHFGTVELLQVVRQQGVTYLQVESKGLTAMLLQNQLTPGLHSAMSLNRLMTEFYTFPEELTWESNADTSNYLYVKENASMWDGVANLTYKLYERYPFIRGSNEIRMTLPTSYQHFSAQDSTLLGAGMLTDQSAIYSDFYMADADGTYAAFHQQDTEAAARGIVRSRQLTLDRQYLYNPQQALVFRQKFAQRRLVRYFVEVPGVSTLSLGDRLTYGEVLQQAPITGIRITGSRKGLRTRLEACLDGFYGNEGE